MKGNEKRSDSADDRTTTYRRSAGLAVLAVAAALALTACGGGSSSPHVASLASSSGSSTTTGSASSTTTGNGSSTTKPPKADATRFLNEWATCMHGHGDPNQPDPVMGSDKTIQINIPGDAQSLSGAVHAGTAPCNRYLTAAQRALRNGQPFPQPSLVTEVKFAECIRANGVPNYPNPSGPNGSETNFNGTGIDPNSPQVQNVTTYCTKKLDIHWAYNSALGDAGDIQVSSGGPNGGPPPNGGPNRPRPAPGGNGGAGAGSGSGTGG